LALNWLGTKKILFKSLANFASSRRYAGAVMLLLVCVKLSIPDRQEASRGLSATAELLVLTSYETARMSRYARRLSRHVAVIVARRSERVETATDTFKADRQQTLSKED